MTRHLHRPREIMFEARRQRILIDLDDALAKTVAEGFLGIPVEVGSEVARDAVCESGVFVHNAINHAHWKKRLTSPSAADRAEGP